MHPFYEEFKDLSQKELNHRYINACNQGNLEVIRYVLTSPELKHHADINTDNGFGLQAACEYGDLTIVKYLIHSPELKENIIINGNIDEGFLGACLLDDQRGFRLVEYLLTSPELKQHADINIDNGQGFIVAVNRNNLKLAKYLTSSPDLTTHINPHTKDDLAFMLIMQNALLEDKNLDILNYLIFDLNIQKTEKIGVLLESQKYRKGLGISPRTKKHDLIDTVNKLFETRDLNKELSNELSSTSVQEKKQLKI